jgi:septal ring factor EnvC (AmiA/AmiB activator)
MKISSTAILKIVSGFAIVLAIAFAGGAYFFFHQSLQAQSALTQQTEELESASTKIKELEAKTKELESKNEEATASIEKFSQSNKELVTQLDELNKEVAAYEALQKKPKPKAKAKN